MNRRGFLSSILALGAAPAIVRADSLMRVVPRETTVIDSQFYDGIQWTEYDLAASGCRDVLLLRRGDLVLKPRSIGLSSVQWWAKEFDKALFTAYLGGRVTPDLLR